MDDQMNYFELQAVKDKPLANTLGELKLKAGERAWLVDDETVYVKIKNANGNIGFVPSSSLKNKPNLEDKDGLIFMVVCSYNKRENDELSITTGELVRIKAIADDGWCYAKSNSKWGWIPGNHLIPQFAEPETSNMYDNLAVAFDEELDYSPEKQPSADQRRLLSLLKPYLSYGWFFHKTSIGDCQSILMEQGEYGDFLIRVRNDMVSLSVMVKTDDGVKNFMIEIRDDQFCLAGYMDASLTKLIEHFSKQSIGKCECGFGIFLKKPIKRHH